MVRTSLSRLLPIFGALVFTMGAFDDGCIITVEPVEPEECDLVCEFGFKHDLDGNAFCECKDTDACIEIAAAPHANPDTGECVDFPSVCDIPDGWEPCEGTCTVDGTAYVAGDLVPSDACESCRCRADGEIICEALDECGACVYNGQIYDAGDRFPADDGCNECFCDEDGGVACTEIACGCDDANGECGCNIEGIYVDAGDSIALDECTWCTCYGDGEWDCSIDDWCGCDGPDCGGCYYEGEFYNQGDEIFVDECTWCTCGEDGELYCDDFFYEGCCFDEESCGCFVDDQWIPAGETIEIGLCEWCSCEGNGELLCYAADCWPTCEYNDEFYLAGDSFPSDDGCNTCTCDDSGEIYCTEIACCIDDNGDGQCDDTCVYNGAQHSVGSTFPAGDGCNACTCLDNGQVVCTLAACVEPVNCDDTQVYCRSLPPLCEGGMVPSVVDHCWGECVTEEQCGWE